MDHIEHVCGTYKYAIRPAQFSDLGQLPAIEASAGSLFLSVPSLAQLADDEPLSVRQHEEMLRAWRLATNNEGGTWIAIECESNTAGDTSVGSGGIVIAGFVVASVEEITLQFASAQEAIPGVKTDGIRRKSFIHIHEMSVHPDHQRRGLASRLLGVVQEYSAQRSMDIVGVTLTTMRDALFNAPFYRKLGFEEILVQDMERYLGSSALAILEEDKQRFRSLEAARCFMIRWSS